MDLKPILDLTTTAPITQGLSAVIDHFLTGASRVLPGVAVGACVVDSPGGVPIIATRLPPGIEGPIGRDPSRLFPGFRDERVLELADGTQGSTFHLAHATALLTASEIELGEILNQAFGAMLDHARQFQQRIAEKRVMARSQAKLIQTEKLASLGQIVAGVVHELNNPLTSIIAYSDYLKKRALKRGLEGQDVSDDVERLRRIGDAAERILKFSRDLVAYARPSTDIPGPVALAEVIDKAIVFCEHEFGKSSIVVSKRVPSDLPPVRGIAGQLTQVFVNLFTNAAHAMYQTGGVLGIEAHWTTEETVVVEVADSGVGIPDEDLEQIFEPFFTTKVDGAGTGLGLSIVRDIVKQHGGDLTAERRPDKGMLFRLLLPVVAVPPSLRPAPRSQPAE